jgi:hypothetical protein
MIGGKAKARDNASISITVDGAEVKPANSFELLGSPLAASSWCGRTCTTLQGRPGSGPAALHACHNISPWTTATSALEQVADGQTDALPSSRGTAEAAWVNGNNPGGVGISASRRQQRGAVHRRPQEGRPHPHCGPAGGGKVIVAKPAGGPCHGHGSLECLRQQRRHRRHAEPGWQLDVWQRRPAGNSKTNKSDNGGYKLCLKFTAVRRSRFDHRELSISLWDGDKLGKTFWQIFQRSTTHRPDCSHSAWGKKTCRVHRIRAASVRRKVIKTDVIHQVGTVSDGGRMERRIESPIKGEKPFCEAKTTCRVHRIRAASASRGMKRSTRPTRPIRCEPCQKAAGWRGGLKTPSKGKSPPARQRRPSLPTACRVHRIWAASASRGTKRSTRPTRPISCGPCQMAAGWRGGLQTPLKGKRPPARQRRLSWPTTTCRVHGIRVASARSV